MTRLLLILPILFEAISEGLYLHGDKVWSKQIQILLIASWFLIAYVYATETHYSNLPRLKLLGKYILLYVLFRVILFNYMHNLSAGLPLDYIGTVSFVDRIVVLVSFGQLWFIGLFQVICGVLAYNVMKGKL